MVWMHFKMKKRTSWGLSAVRWNMLAGVTEGRVARGKDAALSKPIKLGLLLFCICKEFCRKFFIDKMTRWKMLNQFKFI